jgi:hypothetical protein
VRDELRGWTADGGIRWDEWVVDGVEHAVGAILGMMRGESAGKALMRIPARTARAPPDAAHREGAGSGGAGLGSGQNDASVSGTPTPVGRSVPVLAVQEAAIQQRVVAPEVTSRNLPAFVYSSDALP